MAELFMSLEPGDGRSAYDTDQPWVCWTFLTNDADIPPEGGETEVRMTCAICGLIETITIDVPGVRRPPPPPGWEHPERAKFKAEHVHRLQQTAPETWRYPLLNPQAHDGVADIMANVMEKAVHEKRRLAREDEDSG